MIPFAVAIFAGAFLLFQVQPIVGKFILPWFGGGPAVWTTCMLFFQVVLLTGYAYAHLSTRRLRPPVQAIAHAALLVGAAALLPVAPPAAFRPPDADAPVVRILALLAVSVGIPAFVLSSTGPLLQRWFTRVRPGRSPYPLFALSNLASLLALVSYPFLVEPALSRRSQSVAWSWGFVVFAAASAACAWRAARAGLPDGDDAAVEDAAAPPPGVAVGLMWLLLPACACVLLLSTTSQICVDVASIPFLWILPLALYLLSFVLCFESPRWYRRFVWLPLLAVSLAAGCSMLFRSDRRGAPILAQIGVHCAVLFVGAMVCHGELARLRPGARRLTSYYLAIAAGGAAGGAFVTLGAPRLFDGYYELHAAWLGCALLAFSTLFLDARSPLGRGRRPWAWAILAVLVAALAIALGRHVADRREGTLELARDFYGVLDVVEFDEDDPSRERIELSHGTTLHGVQFRDPARRRQATTYYGEESGVGRALASLAPPRGRRIGVVGLGAGTLAAYGRAGDRIRFYEISPAVARVAAERFTYLADSPARCEVVLGDARLSLEREPGEEFDLLALDAFSSDAVPVHLLTREAFGIYLRRLEPRGILAVHLSNAYLDLEPVVAAAAAEHGLAAVLVRDLRGPRRRGEAEKSREDAVRQLNTSVWALLARDPSVLEREPIGAAARDLARSLSRPPLAWSDDYAPLLPLLK